MSTLQANIIYKQAMPAKPMNMMQLPVKMQEALDPSRNAFKREIARHLRKNNGWNNGREISLQDIKAHLARNGGCWRCLEKKA